jgi:hypothetical protein
VSSFYASQKQTLFFGFGLEKFAKNVGKEKHILAPVACWRREKQKGRTIGSGHSGAVIPTMLKKVQKKVPAILCHHSGLSRGANTGILSIHASFRRS